MKKLLISLILSLIILTSCSTVPRTPYWELVPPPERPRLINLSDDPMRQLTMNMNTLVSHVYRWETWYHQLVDYSQ